jgi:hypothetical protein
MRARLVLPALGAMSLVACDALLGDLRDRSGMDGGPRSLPDAAEVGARDGGARDVATRDGGARDVATAAACASLFPSARVYFCDDFDQNEAGTPLGASWTQVSLSDVVEVVAPAAPPSPPNVAAAILDGVTVFASASYTLGPSDPTDSITFDAQVFLGAPEDTSIILTYALSGTSILELVLVGPAGYAAPFEHGAAQDPEIPVSPGEWIRVKATFAPSDAANNVTVSVTAANLQVSAFQLQVPVASLTAGLTATVAIGSTTSPVFGFDAGPNRLLLYDNVAIYH